MLTTTPDARDWTYLSYGPFENQDDYEQWMRDSCLSDDPLFFTVLDQRDGRACGVASLMRQHAEHGVIEVGHIHFCSHIQRSRISTESLFLLMQLVFDEHGFRRLEWK